MTLLIITYYIIPGDNSYSLEINLTMLHDLEEAMKLYKYSYGLVHSQIITCMSFKFQIQVSNDFFFVLKFSKCLKKNFLLDFLLM